jgi:hypothetical protein
MKKIVLLSSFFLVTTLFADDIDDIINKINSKRESKVSKDVIANVKSPIPNVKIVESNSSNESNTSTVLKSEKEVFELKGIINNSAKINNKWVKVGDAINSYKVIDIMEDAVYLEDGNKSKMIFFNKTNNIKIFTR